MLPGLSLPFPAKRLLASLALLALGASPAAAQAASPAKPEAPPVNRPPVLAPATFSGPEDTLVVGQLEANDEDGDALTFKVRRAPRWGTLALDEKTGAFTYAPRPDFHGKDAFVVEVSDGQGAITGEVALEVTPVNDAPVVEALALSGKEDEELRGRVLARDVDGDPLVFSLLTTPQRGAVELEPASGAFTYRPQRDFHGEDSFVVGVSDGQEMAKATVRLTLAPVNDAPVAQEAQFSGREDEPIAGSLGASDVDGDALRFSLRAAPRHGEVSIEHATGGFTYLPKRDFHGRDAFTFEVSDGTLKASAEVTLLLSPVNDAPVAQEAQFSGREDEPIAGSLGASDVDGDALRFSLRAAPRHGEVSIEDATGGFTYLPKRDFHGRDAFTFEVSDGTLKASAEVTLLLSPVNDAPVAQEAQFSGREDEPIAGSLGASDVDGDALRFSLRAAPRHGEVSIEDATGGFTYLPKRDFHGRDAFTFEVSDGTLKASAEVTLLLSPVNDAPVVVALELRADEDTAARGSLVASDVDGDPLRFELTSPPAQGEAAVDPTSGAVRYLPSPDFFGEDAFTVTVSDGQIGVPSGVRVTISPVPDPPRISDVALELDEDEEVIRALPASDPDGDPLTFRLLSSPRLGVAVLDDPRTGRVLFTPTQDAHGEDALVFEVSDGHFTVNGTARILIRPVNDAPTLEPLVLSTIEEVTVSSALRGYDVDGDALTFRIVEPPKLGRAFIDEQGRAVFVPARDQTGTERFAVIADDGRLKSLPAEIVVEIENVNDAPVASDLRFTTPEDVALKEKLVGSDVDGDPLVFGIVTGPAHGEVELLQEGVFRYQPTKDYFGFDSFTYEVSDGELRSAPATVRLSITPVNDAPVGIRDHLDAPIRGRVTRRLQGADLEGQPVRFRIHKQPAIGKVQLLDAKTGEYAFVTDGRGIGQATFQFVVNDGELDSMPVEVTVNVR
jgi:large repetitive protein